MDSACAGKTIDNIYFRIRKYILAMVKHSTSSDSFTQGRVPALADTVMALRDASPGQQEDSVNR